MNRRQQAMGRYVQVLEQQVQQAQTQSTRAHQRLQQTQSQMTKLEQLRQTAILKNSVGNVALYANAAVFRSGLMEMAEQFRDACNVQQMELEQARQQWQQRMRRQESMAGVLQQMQEQAVQERARQDRKVMDELAGQAWMRQRRNTHEGTGSC